MVKKYDLSNKNEMRRKDRSVEDEKWMKEFLAKAPYGHIASVFEGEPFITMLMFVYDPETHALYMHTSRQGRLFSNIQNSDKVCFSVGELGRLLPADTAREFSNEYASIVIFGRCEVMADMMEARDKMHLMIDKYFPDLDCNKDYRAITKPEISEIATYKVTIDSWSGKKKEAAADFPGARPFNL